MYFFELPCLYCRFLQFSGGMRKYLKRFKSAFAAFRVQGTKGCVQSWTSILQLHALFCLSARKNLSETRESRAAFHSVRVSCVWVGSDHI